jgi:hypothetical protein
MATAADSSRLPYSAVWWFVVRIVLTAIGMIVAGLPEQASKVLYEAAPSSVKSYLDDVMSNPKPYMVTVGALLVLFGTVASFYQERTAARAARNAWKDSLLHLDQLRRAAGPQIGRIIDAAPAKRRQELEKFQDLILEASSRKWNGKNEAPRLGYYLADREGKKYTLQRERVYPTDSDWNTTVASYPAPLEYMVRKKLKPTKHPEAQIGPLRGNVLQVPVRSPLEPSSDPLGLVIVDSPDGRVFEGEASKINADFMAGWLATGQLTVRPGE